MESSRKTADRIRPILEVMERSIRSARQKRTNASEGAAPGVSPPPLSTPSSPPAERHDRPTSENTPAHDDDKPAFARMKARPKRINGFPDSAPPSPYRTAG